ncbi:hypothetical protein N8913_05060 [Litoricola sp.]|nr:hypothetical protein [Litorivicinus sp.]
MARRRPRKSGARRGDEKGIGWFIGVGIILLSVTAIIAIVVNRPEVPVLDPVTLCDQEKAPRKLISLIVDGTDSVSELHVAEVKKLTEQIVFEAPAYSRVDFYEISETGNHIKPFSMCIPPDGSEADELFENPILMKRRFEEKFLTVFNETMARLLTQKPAKQSPIIESVQSVAVEAMGVTPGSHHMILVSDLLQHSNKFSFYREKPNMPRYLEVNSNTGGMFAKLNNADVSILIIPRKMPMGRKSDLLEFWADWMQRSNANPSKMEMEPLS